MAAFHFSTLEEYYVGTLELPVCNAVSDGALLVILIYVVTGCFSNDIWIIQVCNGEWLHIDGITTLTLGQIVVAIMTTLSVLVVFGK